MTERAEGEHVTITSDNDTGFHDYASVEAVTGTKFCFATPCHSWERRSNENLYGLQRLYLPKKASQAHITQADCDALAKRFNTKSRKRLGYRTPEQCFLGS